MEWSNQSVRLFAQDDDPIELIRRKAQYLVFKAMESSWTGPPYDPFELARVLKIKLLPLAELPDARIVPTDSGALAIEFNPNRNRARVRYSIAHEIAHTLFPDCAEKVRNRLLHSEATRDEWQLEMLCNIAASEMLMPIGSIKDRLEAPLSIDSILSLRETFEVSTEAVLNRMVRLSSHSCLAFAARKREGGYQVDYSVNSPSWSGKLNSGYRVPNSSVIGECTAIGFTAKKIEQWDSRLGRTHVECVGIPPYPGDSYPRVVGVLRPTKEHDSEACLKFVTGDAISPRGFGSKMLIHVVSDGAFTWGAGFALALRKKWPQAQRSFTDWARSDARNLSLGNTKYFELEDGTRMAHLVAQRGYGPTPHTRLRYAALEKCLRDVATTAQNAKCSIHMPRIGSGEAGGNWSVVQEMVTDILCRRGLRVTVYDLPIGSQKSPLRTLPLFAAG